MAFAYMGSTFIPPLFGFVADNSTLGIFPIFLFIILGIMALSSEILNKQASKGWYVDHMKDCVKTSAINPSREEWYEIYRAAGNILP